MAAKTAPRCTTRGSVSRATSVGALAAAAAAFAAANGLAAGCRDALPRGGGRVCRRLPLVGRDALSPKTACAWPLQSPAAPTTSKVDGQCDTPWPEEGAKQLAAILLVIFVQSASCTASKTPRRAHEFCELLELLRSAGVTRSDLITELIDVDKEGERDALRPSNEIARLWVASPEGRCRLPARLRAVLSSEGDGGSEFERGSWSNESLPELAREARLGGIAAPATPLYRRRLFLRSRRFRICSTAVVVIWLLCTEFICFSRFYGHDFAQVMLFATSCSFGTSIVVASFPTDLAAQKRFTLLPTCATALSVITATYSEFFYLSDAHVNTACKLVHAALCLAVNATWSSSAILSAHGSYSWQKARLVYLCDGLSFLITTILLSHLARRPHTRRATSRIRPRSSAPRSPSSGRRSSPNRTV